MIQFAQAKVRVFADRVETSFDDGTVSKFYPPVDSAEFQAFARMFGYIDAMQFGLEHDVAHSWVAMAIGKPYSDVVWADAHGGLREKSAKAYDDDEHLTARMQLYLNTGKVDDDYGVLCHTFGAMLPTQGQRLWRILRDRVPKEIKRNAANGS